MKKLIKQLNKLLPDDLRVFEKYEFNLINELGCENKYVYNLRFTTIKQPTKQGLLEKAKRDYPIGTKFKNMDTGSIQTVKSEEHYYGNLCVCCGGTPKSEWQTGNSNAALYEDGKWAKVVKRPIFHLNNKPMYEGDEYWLVNKNDNWRLRQSKVISICNIENEKHSYIRFLTKQEALEYVLKEAKEMFDGYKVKLGTNDIFEIKVIHINDELIRIDFTSKCGLIWTLWQKDYGWVAEPIKETLLMLGDEVVDILPAYTGSTDKFRNEIKNNSPKTKIYCKGESVTKEEWMEWYKAYCSVNNNVLHEYRLMLGSFETVFKYFDSIGEWRLKIGCDEGINDIPMSQIEAITKALEKC